MQKGASISRQAPGRASGVIAPKPRVQVTANTAPPDSKGHYLAIVRFNEESLAAYQGGRGTFAAPARNARGRIDMNAASTRAYLDFLQGRQGEYLARAGRELSRDLQVERQFLNVLNAAAVRVTLEEANELNALPFVRSVHLDEVYSVDTYAGPQWIGAPAVWDGDTSLGTEYKGEGMVIGIIDSGFNFGHPSFSETAPDGYDYAAANPLGAGNFLGACLTTHPSYCNNKVIGAYSFHTSVTDPQDNPNPTQGGHGTHTGSTAGGNAIDAVYNGATIPISGVAPHAHLISYKVCHTGTDCAQSSSISSVNQAISDGVDVLNFSISGSANPYTDVVDQAFLDATAAGIYVSASAGNSGPNASTTAHNGPWIGTVANSSHNGALTAQLSAAGVTGVAYQPTTVVPITSPITSTVTDVIDVAAANELGCNPYGSNVFAGSWALIQRGTCAFADKVNNAAAAGAQGVIVFNNAGGPLVNMAVDGTTIPSVFITQADGLAIRAALTSPGGALSIDNNLAASYSDTFGDVVNQSSSRGPTAFDILKPDFSAPGTNVLAGVTSAGGNFDLYSGTSMSSPHAAGAAALLRGINPTWSVSAIKSAIALTAHPTMLKENATTASDPFDRGSGRVNLAKAANIAAVMDETAANYAASNPAAAGDPRTLNMPYVIDDSCIGTCVFTRELTSVSDDPVTYSVTVSQPGPGVQVAVNPTSFTLDPTDTQAITVTVTVDDDAIVPNAWTFGEILLQPVGAATTVLSENFTSTTFPPAGWASQKIGGAGTIQWVRQAPTPTPAYRQFGGSTEGMQDDWLITPQLTVPAAGQISFSDRVQYPGDYYKHSLWISTGSCNPLDGDFVEIAETGVNPTGTDYVTKSYSLASYAGQDACLAFRYEGDFASSWYVDDVVISGLEPGAAPALRMPVVIKPKLAPAEIDVSPASVAETIQEGAEVAIPVEIGNVGGEPLNWNVVSDAAPLRHSRQGALLRTGVATAVNERAISRDVGRVQGLGRASQSKDVDGAGHTPAPDLILPGTGDSITHSNDVTTIADSLTCGTAAISALRVFRPADFGFAGDFNVTSVSFGIGSLSPGQTLTANVYLYNPSNPFTYANLNLIGSGSRSYSAVSFGNGYITNIPVSAVVPAGQTMVVEIKGTGAFGAGANLAGETAPSYLSSPTCGGGVYAQPTSYAAVGFGELAVVMQVHSEDEVDCGVNGHAEWAKLAPASGTIARQSTETAVLTLDATGLSADVYESNLCIASNDSSNAVVVVPVELEVEPGPDLEVAPTEIDVRMAADSTDSAILTLTSVGELPLSGWSIDEAVAGRPEEYRYGRPGGGQVARTSAGAAATRSNPVLAAGPGSGQNRVDPAPQGAAIATLTEGFEDFTALPGAGWAFQNNSTLASTGAVATWIQGASALWNAHQGTPASWAMGKFNVTGNGPGLETISDWMITPEVVIQNGTELTFWTRQTDTGEYPERMQVRLSTNGASVDVGTTPTSVGDFTTLLVDINPDYLVGPVPGGYPVVWTQYTVTLSGVATPTTGRFAFRHFVEDGGPDGTYSDNLGVDTVSITQPPPPCDSPTDIPWLSVSPASSSGPLAPGSSDTVTVTLDSNGLSTGIYEAQLCINSDAGRGRIQVPVKMTVGDDPTITVDPASISANVDFGGSTTQTLAIGNDGDFDLEWSVFESEAARGGYAGATLYDQIQYLDPNLYGALGAWDLDEAPDWVFQMADDFTVPAGRVWKLDRVSVDGFYPASIGPGPVPPGGLSVYVYADDGGKPAGPSYEDPAEGALFAFEGLDATEDNDGAFIIDLPGVAELPEGTYWISVQPRMDYFVEGSWAWLYAIPPAGTGGAHWQYRTGPGNSDCQDWENPVVCGLSAVNTQPGLAFSLHGEDSALAACAAAEDIPWLNVPVNSGTVTGRSSTSIDVQINASGVAPGTHQAILCVTSNDPANPVVEVPVSLSVGAPDLEVQPATLADGTYGVSYSESVTATGDGATAPFTFAVTSGALPDGLTLAADGTLSGTPTAAGSFTFTITATDSTPAGAGGPFSGSQSYTVVIAPATQAITFDPLPNRNLGETFNLKATASSGLAVEYTSNTPTVCTVTGSQVTTIAVGTCSITASQPGDANFLAADDVIQAFDVVDPEITIAPGSVPDAVLDVDYNVTLTASGDSATAPFTFSLESGTLPPGIDLAADGTLSGTPTAVGVYEFVVKATDSTPAGSGGPFSGTQAYEIEVLDLPLFADGFEDAKRSIELGSFNVKVASLDLVDDLAVLGEGEHLVAELTVQGKRIGFVQARCAASCEVRVVSLKADATWQAGPWMLIDSDPFELPLETGASYIR